jgi:hypothetical protein
MSMRVSTAVAACATIGLLSNSLFVRSLDQALTILTYVARFVKIVDRSNNQQRFEPSSGREGPGPALGGRVGRHFKAPSR